MKESFTIKDLKAAFKAGERYGSDITLSFEDGLPVRRPDFDRWCVKFLKEKQKMLLSEIMKDDQKDGIYE